MNPSVVIRPATERDVDRIVRLSNAGGPEGKPREPLPSVLPSGYLEAFARIAADPNQFLMVIEYEDHAVGTFHLTYLTYLAAQGAMDAQIEAFHIDEGFRNQGIGSAALDWIVKEARQKKCRRLQLTTDKRRRDAHRFYERHGFVASHEGMKRKL